MTCSARSFGSQQLLGDRGVFLGGTAARPRAGNGAQGDGVSESLTRISGDAPTRGIVESK